MASFRHPASIAIVGCRPMPSASVGSWLLHNLLLHDPAFEVYPVNPDVAEIDGRSCYSSVARLPAPAELVLVAAPPRQALTALREADSRGSSAAVVFASKEAGADEIAFEASLRDFAGGSHMTICGPNSNGFFNVTDLVACTSAPFAALPDPPRGNVAVASHSGALVTSLVKRIASSGLGLSYTCAVGNSVDVDLADFLHLLAEDEATSTVLVYVEGLADRTAFFSAADAVIAAGKHVVVLKAGRSPEGKAAVQAHSGVLAGATEAFRAACEHRGLIFADDFEEFVTLPALLRRRHAAGPAGYHVGIAAGSGAIGAMLTDTARAHGFAVPQLAAATVAVVDPSTGISMANPLDLAVHDAEPSHSAIQALAADPNIGHVVFGIQSGPRVITAPIHRALAAVAEAGTDVLVWSVGGTTSVDEPILTAADIPVVTSAQTLFGCLRKVLDRTAPSLPDSGSGRVRAATDRSATALSLLDRARPGVVPGEIAWRLLDLYGVPTLPEHPVDLANAPAVAERLGYPVVAKLVGSELAHKSDLGLVELDLRNAAAVRDAVQRLATKAERIGDSTARIILQKSAAPGCELILAARWDGDAGPYVVVGLGGIFTEILSDVVIAPAPVTPSQGVSMVLGLRGAGLVVGDRGGVAGDLGGLGLAVCAVSELVADLCGRLGFLEVNPLIVSGDGVVAVDVLASVVSG